MGVFIEQTGSGQDLVLLHGWGFNGAVWQEIVPLLAPYYRLHLVDLPGFGHSHECVMSDMQLSAWSELVIAQLPAQFNLLGWSMGGLIAQRMALDHPLRVQKLILTGSTPCFVQQENWPGIQPDVLSSFHRLLQQDPRKTIERFLAIQAMGSESVKEDVKRLKNRLQLRPQASLSALDGGLNLLATVDLRAELAQLQCPVLGLYGRLDSLVPVRVADAVSTLLSNSHSVVFAHAAHTPFVSHPQPFADALCAFLG